MENQMEYFGADLEAMSNALNYQSWILSEFAPYINGNIAEVGSGTGSLTKCLLERYAEKITCFEPSANMYPILESKFSGEPRVRTIAGDFSSKANEFGNEFTTFIYVNVLEHVEHDEEEIKRVFQSLISGGHLLILVPALNWLMSDFDRKIGHYRRYHRQPLESLIQRAGFSLVYSKYMDFFGILPWWLLMVKMRSALGSGNVSLYDRYMIPIIRLLETRISPPLGKNLLIVAKKP